MIRRVKYNEIDFEKYTQCLENSFQRKYSATKQFLDLTLGKKWELLVYGDYEAVMPIPYVLKFGLKIVQNPKLCQQLGIFSHENSQDLNDEFLKFLMEKYAVRLYSFNDGNQFSLNLKTKKNYLMMPNSYEKVYSGYSPKRKRKLRLDPEFEIQTKIKTVSFKEAENFIRKNIKGGGKINDTEKYISLFSLFYSEKILEFHAFYFKKEIINLIATYQDHKTVALLGTFNDPNFVKFSGASVLIDYMMKRTVETKIFDFEGGDLPSLDEFFRGFRPEMKPYSYILNGKKELAKFLIKKNFRI